MNDVENLLVADAEYEIYTPYSNEEAAQILWEALQKFKETGLSAAIEVKRYAGPSDTD